MTLPKVESPTFKVTIPSTKQEVTLRCMRVREEKILLMAKEGNDPGEILSAVKQVVGNCVVGTSGSAGESSGPDINNLAIFDIEYMFLRLRAMSVSDKTEVAYIDNDEIATAMAEIDKIEDWQKGKKQTAIADAQKKATYTFTIDLNKVEVKFPKKEEKTIKINDKAGIVLKYPPAALYSDKEFMSAEGEKLIELLVEKSIETIYDGKDVTNLPIVGEGAGGTFALKEWIEDLDIKTYNKIKEFFNNLPHLHYEIKYTNKNGKDRKITLTTLNDFFMLA